ncbi:DnaJ protein [Abortiporus biennis]|nr:DnaJ protein [Abortiporus biennis]
MSTRLVSRQVRSFISVQSCSRTQPRPREARFSTYVGKQTSRNVHRRESVVSFASRPRSFHSTSPTQASKDPYEVLGVQRDATAAQIKKVYFSLARKYHPDTNPDKDAKAKFVEIQEAYDILKDDKKRAAYDQYGSASQQPGFDPNAFGRGGQSPFGAGGFGFNDFASMFGGAGGRSSRLNKEMLDELFGGFAGGARGRGHTEMFKGDDIQVQIGISFMEACKGTSRTIPITPVTDCGTCHGTGLKAGAKRTTCTSCGGTGTRIHVIDNGFQMASTCTACGGSGSAIPRGSQCGDCAGQGQVRTHKTVKVDIPAGVEDGMKIKIPNAGDVPIGGKGQPGDLTVRVSVTPSKLFRRQGINLYHDARIPLHTALLGGKVRVPTLDGEVDVRIPSGTQQGEEMVIKGRGVPSVFNSDKGDLFVTCNVTLPRSLTQRQREILQQYADDIEGRTPSHNSGEGSKERPPSASDSEGKRSGEKNANEDEERKTRATA